MAHRLLERYTPAYVIVDGDFEILEASSGTGAYLELPRGRPNANLGAMARDELAVDIKAAVSQVMASGERLVRDDLLVGRGDERQSSDADRRAAAGQRPGGAALPRRVPDRSGRRDRQTERRRRERRRRDRARTGNGAADDQGASSEHDGGARDLERGAAGLERGAVLGQRGAAILQRGAGDLEGGASVDQRGTAHRQQRALDAGGGTEPGQQRPQEPVHEHADRDAVPRPRVPHPQFHAAGQAAVPAARPRRGPAARRTRGADRLRER